MKLGLKAVCALLGGASLAVLGTGIAVATTTTTHPITLCAGRGTITYASNGTCPSSTTALRVAVDSDLAALAGRVDTAEGSISSLQSSVSSLSSQLATAQQTISQQGSALSSLSSRLTDAETALHAFPRLALASGPITGPECPCYGFRMSYSGWNLKPGTTVVLHYIDYDGSSIAYEIASDTVAADGTYTVSDPHRDVCSQSDFYLTGIAPGGETVTSNFIHHGPGCA